MLEINKAWSEGDTLRFIRSHFNFLSQYSERVFEGIDGRVLLGLTTGNVGKIIPELTEKHRFLFLTKLNSFLPSASASSAETVLKRTQTSGILSCQWSKSS
jgi:hypothetical protein